jgi:hypothetical protein
LKKKEILEISKIVADIERIQLPPRPPSIYNQVDQVSPDLLDLNQIIDVELDLNQIIDVELDLNQIIDVDLDSSFDLDFFLNDNESISLELNRNNIIEDVSADEVFSDIISVNSPRSITELVLEGQRDDFYEIAVTEDPSDRLLDYEVECILANAPPLGTL